MSYLDSGLGNIGADRVMDFIVDYTPAPSEHEWVQGEAEVSNGDAPRRHETDAEPVSLYVFKTVSDPFAGRISYFKVFSGVMKNDATLQNFTRGSAEKLAHISVMQGKTALPVPELHAGDIGAVAKLKDTLTGDTLGDKAAPIQYPRVQLPEPAMTFAIEPKSRADEDKLGTGIHKLMEEDPMLRFFRDPQTKEFLIAGTGQQHIEVDRVEAEEAVSHGSDSEGAEGAVSRDDSRQGRRAGAAQEADGRTRAVSATARSRWSRCRAAANFEFVNDIFGGAIPQELYSRGGKGNLEAAARGYLAGFPVVDFRVILYDGSYHDVDSNELSFKMAGRIAFKKAHGAGEADAAGAGDGGGDYRARTSSRDDHGRPEQPARAHSGHGQQGRQYGGEGRSSDGGDADLWRGADFDDAGPRQLQYGNGSLRLCAGAAAGKDYREGAGGTRGSEGRRRVVASCGLGRREITSSSRFPVFSFQLSVLRAIVNHCLVGIF